MGKYISLAQSCVAGDSWFDYAVGVSLQGRLNSAIAGVVPVKSLGTTGILYTSTSIVPASCTKAVQASGILPVLLAGMRIPGDHHN